VLVLGFSFSTQVISTSEMARGIESLLGPLERLRLPVHDGLMALVVAVRFLPFLAQSAERIAKAQAARGAEWAQGGGGTRNPLKALRNRARGLLPLLVPVFVTSLRRAETMAMAMDARGYASRARPTALMELRFGWRDALAVLVGLAVTVAMFLV
jgi:energy-coupling factor transport system permease protein